MPDKQAVTSAHIDENLIRTPSTPLPHPYLPIKIIPKIIFIYHHCFNYTFTQFDNNDINSCTVLTVVLNAILITEKDTQTPVTV